MTKAWWIFLYVFSGGMDFIQLVFIEGILVWFGGAGAAINEMIDPFVGVIIGGVLAFKGVPLRSRPNRVIALMGSEIAAIISAGVAQFWIASVLYIHRDVRQQEAGMKAAMEQEEALQENAARTFLYEEINGEMVRRPQPNGGSGNNKPLNYLDGIRPPNGGLNPA